MATITEVFSRLAKYGKLLTIEEFVFLSVTFDMMILVNIFQYGNYKFWWVFLNVTLFVTFEVLELNNSELV